MNIHEIYYTYATLSQVSYIDLSPEKITGSPYDKNVIVAAAASDEQERVPL